MSRNTMQGYVEDQYKVVASNGIRLHVSFKDTVQEAIDFALEQEKADVYRPDGTYVGTYYSRERKAPK